MGIAEKLHSIMSLWVIVTGFSFAAVSRAASTQASTRPTIDAPFTVGTLLASDDFSGLDNWSPELEEGGTVRARDAGMEIDVPAGCTVWLKEHLDGPLLIEYRATVLSHGGPNDRVSDLNCFWMATDSRSPNDLFATHRSGKFADYNLLKCYYVGLGGNSNTTTRFRRYVGDAEARPLLPQNELRDQADLIVPNVTQTIRLVAAGSLVQFYRDQRKVFEIHDDEPYTSGWFGVRTTHNHMLIKNFRAYRLVAKPK